jgi:hypothetical protein
MISPRARRVLRCPVVMGGQLGESAPGLENPTHGVPYHPSSMDANSTGRWRFTSGPRSLPLRPRLRLSLSRIRRSNGAVVKGGPSV